MPIFRSARLRFFTTYIIVSSCCGCSFLHTVHVVPRCHAPNPCLPQQRDIIPHVVIVASRWFLFYLTYIDDARSNTNQVNINYIILTKINFKTVLKNCLILCDFFRRHIDNKKHVNKKQKLSITCKLEPKLRNGQCYLKQRPRRVNEIPYLVA